MRLDGNNLSVWTALINDSVNVGINEGQQIANEFSLSQNYPNPFNPTTDFRFQIAEFRFVSLKVFDILGKEIATLVNKDLQPENYSIPWDASNLPSGMYFYRLTAGSFSETKKLMLMK